MKLRHLYRSSDKDIFLEYIDELRYFILKTDQHIINEAKITITIDDDEDNKFKIPKETREKFINGAKELGNFHNPEWLEQLLRGMKQAGVQGVNRITEEDGPVSRSEIKQLIALLVTLIS